MRLSSPLRAATAAAAIAVSALAAAPAHAGCVDDYLRAGYPGGGKTVTVNPDGSVTVNPNPTLNLAGAVVGNAQAFVDCVK
jgi:hypothetical protein